jgi:hypothetical protein
VNDNNDSNVINAAGYQYSQLGDTIEKVVLPLQERMKARGEHLFVNICYVAFTRQNGKGAAYIHKDPAEYAEFVLATYLHMQNRYRFVPDAWEVLLEPDNVPEWNGNLLGRAILASAARLRAAGFTPRFSAPANTNMTRAIAYFDDMIKVPGAKEDLIEFAYHRYGGVSDASLKAITERAAQHHINTAMLEWWAQENGARTLHQDLKLGCNSAWQQGSLVAITKWVGPMALYLVDDKNPAEPVISMASRTKLLRQYFSFVRPGAVRIDATSSEGACDPLAFINADGRYAVVIRTQAGTHVGIEGLPLGQYGIKYTTGDGIASVKEYNKDLPDILLAAGQPLATSMPDAGIMTVYGKPEAMPPK